MRRHLRRLALAFGLLPGLALAQESFDCVIEPSLTLRLGSPITGIIASIEVERGQAVTRGQVVALMESSVEAATLELARARSLSTAEVEARRSVVSTQRLEELRANAQIAASELALAELNRRLSAIEARRVEAALEQRTIRSPVDGVVIGRNLGPGEYVNQENHILSVAQLDPLHVETFLPVRLHGRVRVGTTATVRPDAPVGGVHSAQIRVVDDVFDAASGTFGVRLTLPNADRALPGGVRCRIEFAGSAASALR